MPRVYQPDPPGLIHDDPRLLPPWRGSSLFWGQFFAGRRRARIRALRDAFPSSLAACREFVHTRVSSTNADLATGAPGRGAARWVDDEHHSARRILRGAWRCGEPGCATSWTGSPQPPACGLSMPAVPYRSSRKAWAGGMRRSSSTRRRRGGCCASWAAARVAHVIVLTSAESPAPATWAAAIAVGAQHVLRCPGRKPIWSASSPTPRIGARRRRPRRGGRGDRRMRRRAARRCSRRRWRWPPPMRCWSTSIPWGGGIDLLVGAETTPGAALARPRAAGRSAQLVGRARGAAAAPRDQRAVGHPARPRIGRRRRCTPSSTPDDAAAPPWSATFRVDCPTPSNQRLDTADLVVVVSPCDVRACAATAALVPVLTVDQSQCRSGGAGPVAGRVAGGRSGRHRRPAAAGGDAAAAAARRAARARRPAVGAALGAGRGGPPGARGAAGGSRTRRTAGRRERLADRPGPRAAGRRIRRRCGPTWWPPRSAPNPAACSATPRCWQSSDAADRTDRRRHPRTAAVRGRDHRRPGHRAGRGVGRRRKRLAAQRRFGSPTKPRCGGWRSGWRWPPAGGSTTRSPGWTAS